MTGLKIFGKRIMVQPIVLVWFVRNVKAVFTIHRNHWTRHRTLSVILLCGMLNVIKRRPAIVALQYLIPCDGICAVFGVFPMICLIVIIWFHAGDWIVTHDQRSISTNWTLWRTHLYYHYIGRSNRCKAILCTCKLSNNASNVSIMYPSRTDLPYIRLSEVSKRIEPHTTNHGHTYNFFFEWKFHS